MSEHEKRITFGVDPASGPDEQRFLPILWQHDHTRVVGTATMERGRMVLRFPDGIDGNMMPGDAWIVTRDEWTKDSDGTPRRTVYEAEVPYFSAGNEYTKRAPRKEGS